VNQFTFSFGVVAGLWCAALVFGAWYFIRVRRHGGVAADATRQAVFEQWPTTALVLDPATLRIVAANPAALRNIGYSLDEVRKLPFTELFSAEGADARVLLARLQEATARTPMELKQRCKDGSVLNVEASCNPLTLDGRPVLAVAVHDVTVRRVVESKMIQRHQHLDHLAHHDQLTGLPNRLYLAAHLPGAIATAKEQGTLLAVLFLDLDRFKHINDSRGHATGARW